MIESRGVLDTTLCDKVYQTLAVGLWFSPGTLVSSTSKTNRHDITQILLKVAFTTITPNPALMVTTDHLCKNEYMFFLKSRLH